jgi:hypothetical protein
MLEWHKGQLGQAMQIFGLVLQDRWVQARLREGALWDWYRQLHRWHSLRVRRRTSKLTAFY